MNFHPIPPSLLSLSFSSFKNQKSSIINHQSIRRISLPLSLLFIFLTSCADKPAEVPSPKPEKEQARLVGRVASIHKNPDFALIQSYGPWNIQTGAILASIGPDARAANLKVTGEKTGQFAAADIQSGTLEIGDSVYTTLSIPISETEEDTNETQIDPQKAQVSEPSASTGEAI